MNHCTKVTTLVRRFCLLLTHFIHLYLLGIFPLINVPTGQNGNHFSAFLFLGGNWTLTLNRTSNGPDRIASIIDLTGLSTYASLGFTSNSTAPEDKNFIGPPLASILICDPQMNVSGGQVTLYQNRSLLVTSANRSAVGNIPIPAARVLLSQSLLEAISVREPYGDTSTSINYIAASLFMSDPTIDDTSRPFGIPPLKLDAINQKMDIFLASAAKAYTDGYRSAGQLSLGDFRTISVAAMGQRQRLKLITSRPLWITTIGIVLLTVILTALLVLKLQDRVSMNLSGVLIVVQSFATPNDVPHIHETGTPLLSLRSHDPIDQLTNLHETSSPDAGSHSLNQRSRLIRIAAFMILELIYIAFTTVCLYERALVLPEFMFVHQTEAKGGFTVLFIIWQALAIFPAANSIRHTFCNEWSYQLSQTGQLIPGTIDKVSILPASFLDRAKHFLPARPSELLFLAPLQSWHCQVLRQA